MAKDSMKSPQIQGGSYDCFPPGSISQVTRQKFEIYTDRLVHWQKVKNLVSHSSMQHVWKRHFLDSFQVQACAPSARIWADLGSGAGFPGLVTAILLSETVGSCVHLIESDHRKCAFLREVSRETGAAAEIHHGRIESVLPTLGPDIEAISARALAPLSDLIGMAAHLLLKGAVGIFPKGQDVAAELTDLAMDSRFAIDLVPSATDSHARVAIVRAASSYLGQVRA